MLDICNLFDQMTLNVRYVYPIEPTAFDLGVNLVATLMHDYITTTELIMKHYLIWI